MESVNGRRNSNTVALYMSAWIEIDVPQRHRLARMVALYMSAWIEIDKAKVRVIDKPSHST